MRDYTIVVLNRYPELARKFIESFRKTHHELQAGVLVICDRHKETLDAQQVFVPGPFVFARNVNLAIAAISGDLILCNDDTQCVEFSTFDRLHSTAMKYPKCGILSPMIEGGVGNPLQNWAMRDQVWEPTWPSTIAVTSTVCFPCVWLSRQMLDQVGEFDEGFVNYGFDDDDYCIRARKAGWWTMVTKSLRIRHGDGTNGINRGYNWSLSFAREPDRPSNEAYFLQKHFPEKTAQK